MIVLHVLEQQQFKKTNVKQFIILASHEVFYVHHEKEEIIDKKRYWLELISALLIASSLLTYIILALLFLDLM
jgi:hypothetical protein